ncbi:MAG: 50S ribosomal protein L22 [Nanoarchaeota archaeon]|nr:50S ribosomal protein L22 [Nanoarchaeota archaeon]
MEEEHTSKASGANLAVSKKFSVVVAKFIRGRKLDKAKSLMESVLTKTVAVPFKKHNRDLGHKRGIGPGRYPIKVVEVMLSLLKSAEMNASNKGLDVDALFVKSIIVNKGTSTMKGGRHRGRAAKRTHINLILEERENKKKTVKKDSKKVEVKEEKKEASKKGEEKK